MSNVRFILCFLGLWMGHCYAQIQTDMVVDRPDITESPFSVNKHFAQLEIGFDYVQSRSSHAFQLPNALLRCGMSNSSELRLGVQHGVIRDRNFANGVSEDFAILGLKKHAYKSTNARFNAAVLTNVAIGLFNIGIHNTQYELILIAQNDFKNKTSLNYNLGLLGNASNMCKFLTSSYTFNLHKNTSAFIETYAIANSNIKDEFGVNLGLLKLLTPNLQIDCLIGYNQLSVLSSSLGFAFRF